jgi:hypothetical protein
MASVVMGSFPQDRIEEASQQRQNAASQCPFGWREGSLS